MWTQAIEQKDKELDLLNIIDTARKANFLKKMQVEPDKVTLAKYSREYRIIAQTAEILDHLQLDREDIRIVETLDRKNSHLDSVLMDKILRKTVEEPYNYESRVPKKEEIIPDREDYIEPFRLTLEEAKDIYPITGDKEIDTFVMPQELSDEEKNEDLKAPLIEPEVKKDGGDKPESPKEVEADNYFGKSDSPKEVETEDQDLERSK